VTDVVWEPTPEVVERARVTGFMRRHGFEDYREFQQRSHDDPEWFWPAVIEDMALEFRTPWDRVVDLSRGPEWATWFGGATLNVAWNCVHRWAERRPDDEAAVFRGEDGARRTVSYRDLSTEVTRLAEALVQLGVREGDAVALYLPMSLEVLIASNACAHVGAIQVPIFSGFAAPAVATRLADSGAKVVVTADGSFRRGREVPMKAIVDQALADAPEVEHVVVWPRLAAPGVPMTAGRDLTWREAVSNCPGELDPAWVDAEAPYLLAYTSGTTGKPKGVLHVQGGFLVSIAREVAYQADAGPEDTILFSTDMGWIMGPWMVGGGGAVGARLVFMEGAPDRPPDRLWRLVEEERATVLGCSPTLIRALRQHGDPEADLSSLRTIVTTGEPWNPDPYRWLFETVGKRRCPIINCSGGTEVGACFLSPVPAIPIKECSLGLPALGMAMDVVDDEGRSLVGTGEVGELACRKPFPGMTRGIWRDPERYLDAYWRRLPGVWVHGDWASVDEDGYWFLHGRSDDTLNIAGKRIGPAELESTAVAHPSVAEAAAVGIPHDVKGEVAWLFCTLNPDAEATDELAAEIAATAAYELGKAFRPDRVIFVSALPKTRSAKIVRRAVRARAIGEDPGDLSSLENPEALDEIARAAQSSPTPEGISPRG
jgi:acetyl-CoA synthetase